MNKPIGIPVNLRNPGEFLACCGLLEVASRAGDGETPPLAAFNRSCFEITGTPSDTATLVALLAGCVPEVVDSDAEDPLAVLFLPALRLRLDWWRAASSGKQRWVKTPFKLWAGQQSSLTIYQTLREAVGELLADGGLPARPLDARCPLTGRFGLDPSAAWNAQDAGFSPNDQGYNVRSSPLTELLAAVGLQRFRPIPVHDDRDAFEYVAWSIPVPVQVAAAAAADAVPDPGGRRYRFRIASRGSYGCFTTATPMTRSP